MRFLFNLCFLFLSHFILAGSVDLLIIKIKNIQNSFILDIAYNTSPQSEGSRVVVWDDNRSKNQRWIVNIDEAKSGACATFEALDQHDGGRIKVLDEDIASSNVAVWGNVNNPNQKWCLVQANNNWLLRNKYTQRCLTSLGKNIQTRTENCNANDNRQLWEIEDSDSPQTWREDWFEHNQLLNRVNLDNDVTIYYDNDMPNSIRWPFSFTGDVWRYTKRVYGNFGPSGRLFAIFHRGKYGGGHPGYFYGENHDYKNLIDCGHTSTNAWSTKDGWWIDVIIHEIGHVVESTFHRYERSPAFPVWKDSKWMEIYTYDVYKGLGMNWEANDRYNQYINQHDSFPSPNTYWFRDWFYPIYSRYGGTNVLKRFFEMLVAHFPKRGFSYSRDMNLGEFVHFWSGAANDNLKGQATIAFGWNSNLDSQFNKARSDFPNIRY